MLTVIKDTAGAARAAADAGYDLARTLESVRAASYESVRRTPELLEVLKENGVVDAGGYGLAILVDGFVAAALGGEVTTVDIQTSIGELHVEPADDWEDDEYLYCTEFLLFGDDIDREAVHDYVASVGGSELVVGDAGSYKVHVHTDDPGAVLAHMTGIGEVAEVHVNNMRRQKQDRDALLESEHVAEETKPVGFVAVAAGRGLVEILRSLGADVVVSGGQTMNPSTADLAAAARSVNAEKIVILPNNKNIQMAASAAASLVDRPVSVVPTRSVPQGFAALLAFDPDAEFEDAVAAMSDAAASVRTGEITTAVKDAKGKTGPIKAGQVIGIVDDEEIDAVGDSVMDVALALADVLTSGAENLTLFAGEELDEAALGSIEAAIAENHPGLEIESHRGDQPLYPLIMSAE
jgi:DAK2 domain fusion protein YloV